MVGYPRIQTLHGGLFKIILINRGTSRQSLEINLIGTPSSIFLNIRYNKIVYMEPVLHDFKENYVDLLPREIMTIIVRKSVNSAGTYRNTIRVCKKWYMLIDHPAMESKYTNHIEKLLKLFPDKK